MASDRVIRKERMGHLYFATSILNEELKEYRKAIHNDKSKEGMFKALATYLNAVKMLHTYSIEEIRILESEIRKGVGSAVNKSSYELIKYFRHTWRRFNDALAWTILLEQRHVVKRLCFFQERSPLPDKFSPGLYDTFLTLNNDENCIALLCDTTSFIDVGDILFRDFRTGEMKLIEMKEGKVNKEIVESDLTDDAQRDYILRKYGPKGLKQVVRISKQTEKLEKVVDILTTEKGIDPLTGLKLRFSENPLADEKYDLELRELVESVTEDKDKIVCIDQCLWAYASRSTIHSHERLVQNFSELIRKSVDYDIFITINEQFGKDGLYPVFRFSNGFHHPHSYPIFLKEFETEQILDLILGQTRILFYIDWQQFKVLLNQVGLDFYWSSKKQGRRFKAKTKNLRPLIIGDKIPIIRRGDVEIMMGPGQLDVLLSIGIRPRVLISQLPDLVTKW